MNKKKLLKWINERIGELHEEAHRYWEKGQNSFRYSAEGKEEILITLKNKIKNDNFE